MLAGHDSWSFTDIKDYIYSIYTPSYTLSNKDQVAVVALRGDKTIAEIAEKFKVHPEKVTDSKTQLLERSDEAFGEKADGTLAPNIEKMMAKIGRLNLEYEVLESALVKAGLLSVNR